MISRYLVGFLGGLLVALAFTGLGCGDDLDTYEGDVLIERPDQIDDYRSYGRISGKLTISNFMGASFSWPELVEVGGELWIWENPTLAGFSFSGLERVEGDVLVRNNQVLTGINLDSLNYVGGTIGVAYNPKLPTCQVNRVIHSVGTDNIGGEISLVGNNDNGGCE